jgi:hypothetical protein
MQREVCEKKYHDGVVRLLQRVIQNEKIAPVAKKTILTGLQSRLESTRVTQKSEVMSGFSRMQACRDALGLLDENGWRRSYHQRLFHDDFIRACTRIFWKREAPGKFAREQCEILRRNNWSHIQQEVLISTPRRFGKTISVSMFAAAMLYSAPCVEISIYATCKRISQKLLRNVVKFFDLICKSDPKGGGFVRVRSNMEELVVCSTQDPTDVRIINSYPSKVGLHVLLAHTHVLLAHTHVLLTHAHTRTTKLSRRRVVQLPRSFFLVLYAYPPACRLRGQDDRRHAMRAEQRPPDRFLRDARPVEVPGTDM